MAKRKEISPRSDEPKRKYLSQTDVPAYGLETALKVAQAIADHYGKAPTKPLRVAQALNTQPLSSNFRMVCGASIAYGLTDGGYNSELIALTPLGRRIVAPTKEGDDLAAKREALLRPRVVRDFLTRYNESRLPSEAIAANVLEEMGVPSDRAVEVYNFIVESAREMGYIREVKGQPYVDFDPTAAAITAEDRDLPDDGQPGGSGGTPPPAPQPDDAPVKLDSLTPIGAPETQPPCVHHPRPEHGHRRTAKRGSDLRRLHARGGA